MNSTTATYIIYSKHITKHEADRVAAKLNRDYPNEVEVLEVSGVTTNA